MSALADLILVVHFAYVLFVVGGLLLIWIGGAMGWRWVRNWWFRVLHLAAIAVVALQALIGVVCPLTLLEDWLRPEAATRGGFIQRWVHALLFYDWPLWVFTILYVAFTAIVVFTFILLPPTRRPRARG